MTQLATSFAFAALVTSCSLGLDDRCDKVETGAGLLRQCSARIDTALWVLAMPEVLADVEGWLPGMTALASASIVEVYDVDDDAAVAGSYHGYDEDPPRITIAFRPEGGNVEARWSALPHEWAHMWEHKIKDVTEDDASGDGVEHFGDYDAMNAMITDVRDPDSEIIWCHPL